MHVVSKRSLAPKLLIYPIRFRFHGGIELFLSSLDVLEFLEQNVVLGEFEL
jgi:hypothetical protein